MSVLIFMIPMALLMGFGFVVAFLWSAKNNQFEDLETPALRILDKENILNKKTNELEDSTSCQNK